jgi:hypothetical protein
MDSQENSINNLGRTEASRQFRPLLRYRQDLDKRPPSRTESRFDDSRSLKREPASKRGRTQSELCLCLAWRNPADNFSPNVLLKSRSVSEEFAFPDDNDIPTSVPQLLKVLPIALPIPADLCFPIARTARGLSSPSQAIVPMPKAAMDKENCSKSWQNNIRLARELGAVDPKPITERVQRSADNHLRCSVFSSNCSHAHSPLYRCQVIHLGAYLNIWYSTLSVSTTYWIRLSLSLREPEVSNK